MGQYLAQKLILLTQLTHYTLSINFAFLNNDLYVNYDDQMDDRGFQSIWGLWQLVLSSRETKTPLPDVIVKINGDATDFWRNVGQSM
jgi:hypothetical protein